MKVLISGATGFVGTALTRSLQRRNDQVLALTRQTSLPGSVTWRPDQGEIDLDPAQDLDAVVHLAGESIACRWNADKQNRILQSRSDATRLLSQSLASLSRPPRVLISASATGYYGDGHDGLLHEDSPAGTGFLARVAQAWEEATEPARINGVRVVTLRIGIVLDPSGGALARLLPVFKLGLGGRVGSGEQYWSWISLRDLVKVILFAIDNQTMNGPVNAVSPHPVTNREFTRRLATVLRRPAWLPVPAWTIRLILGQMGEETLLAGARVEPAVLSRQRFAFLDPELEPALRSMLASSK
jgi:uncharacterized protein